MTNKSVTATKAKTSFAELIDASRKEPITITRNNRPVAVVLSPDEYEHFLALDDAYWGVEASKAETEGALSTKESALLLDSMINARN